MLNTRVIQAACERVERRSRYIMMVLLHSH